MRALSIQQPWASLIIIGAKRIETRSWPCPPHLLGETIAIHASAGFTRENRELCFESWFPKALSDAGYSLDQRDTAERRRLIEAGDSGVGALLPLGAVLGTARVLACAPTDEISAVMRGAPLSEQERAFGDYRPGRWGWILGDVKRFETPVPAKGALGLWRWDGTEAGAR